MSPTWLSEDMPPQTPPGVGGWLRILLRGGAIGALAFGGCALLVAMRLVERPLFGAERPWTSPIPRFVFRNAFRVLGMGFRVTGAPMREAGAVVANHGSWLDIFALGSPQAVYFVSKSEVAGWPGIGWLAKSTGTVFISRDALDAASQRKILAERLAAGHRLAFFPEGTSTDGMRVLAFKSTLFAALFPDRPSDEIPVQPVTVIYRAPEGADSRFYGWWGDMEFGEHLLKLLAAKRQGSVELVYHSPLRATEFADRKELARAAEDAVRSAMPFEPD